MKKSRRQRKKIMEENKRPTNKFRDEIEKEQISDNELMLRDQIIMARVMEANHTLAKFNQQYLESALGELLILHEFMQGRPVSPGLVILAERARVQVEEAKKVLEPPAVSRANLVQLAALHAAIALADLNVAARFVDEALGVSKIEVATQDIKAPIKDDGFGRSDEDQDTVDDTEEEIEMVDPNEVPVKMES